MPDEEQAEVSVSDLKPEDLRSRVDSQSPVPRVVSQDQHEALTAYSTHKALMEAEKGGKLDPEETSALIEKHGLQDILANRPKKDQNPNIQ